MGSFFSRIFSRLLGRGDIRILILGLENAGKTTLLYQLQLNQIIEAVPSKKYIAIGFNVEIIQYQNIKLQMWDLGGQKSFRQHWKCYYHNTKGIIYVIDSTDWARIDIAKQELHDLLQEEDLKNSPVVILANKQDLNGAMNEIEVNNRLGISYIHRKVKVFTVSVKNKIQIEESLNWLIENTER